MRRIVMLTAGLCLVATSLVQAAGPNLKEGQWEMTMKIEMPGLPIAMPPTVFKQCLSAQDAVPQKKEKDQTCTPVNTEIKGDTVSWVVECKDKRGTTRSTGTVTYHGESFEGAITMASVPPNPDSPPMQMKMSGRRLGACPK